MSIFRLRRQSASGLGQENGPVRMGGNETLALQPLHLADNGDVGDSERLGEIRGPGFAARLDEIGDGFDVILRAFLGVLLPGAVLNGSRLLGRSQGGGRWNFFSGPEP